MKPISFPKQIRRFDFPDKKPVPFHFWSPQLPKRETAKKMSIIIGIICPDGIVLAADSLLTGSDGSKSYVDKISVIKFSGAPVLLAQAGLPSITNRIVGIASQRAAGLKITDPSIVTQIIEESIRDIKGRLDDDQKSYGERWGANLMVAFYENGTPHLYTLDVFGTGISTLPSSHYATAGIGSTLASYLLSEFTTPAFASKTAIVASIYAIKKVKENNAYCGGDTTIKLMDSLKGTSQNPLLMPVNNFHRMRVSGITCRHENA